MVNFMKKNYLEEFLINKTEEIKKWSYDDLVPSINTIKTFTENYQNRKINIEIESIKTGEGVMVMVECSALRFFLIYVGKQRFFYKSRSGDVKDIDGNEYYKKSVVSGKKKGNQELQ